MIGKFSTFYNLIGDQPQLSYVGNVSYKLFAFSHLSGYLCRECKWLHIM